MNKTNRINRPTPDFRHCPDKLRQSARMIRADRADFSYIVDFWSVADEISVNSGCRENAKTIGD